MEEEIQKVKKPIYPVAIGIFMIGLAMVSLLVINNMNIQIGVAIIISYMLGDSLLRRYTYWW